jgi:NadR type nicotinamide-nucleotide adenylyltransferase
MIRICFHGAESTGKSVLAERLSRDLGVPRVGEYGREWAETKGTDFTLAALLEIARGQDAAMRAAAAAEPPLLILDTDPLMTAAWAEMLHGEIPAELYRYEKAEHYLLFDPDVPWVADGTRFFGTADLRARFAATAQAVLERAGVAWSRIGGGWEEREMQVRAAISALSPSRCS